MRRLLTTALLLVCAAVFGWGHAHAQSRPFEIKIEGDVWDPGKKKAEDPDEIEMPEEAQEKPDRQPARKKVPSDDEIDIVTPEAGDEEPAAKPKAVKAAPEAEKAKDAGAKDAGTKGAERDGGTKEEPQAAQPAVEADLKAEMLVKPSETLADIYAHWEKRRKALDARDFAAAAAELKTITGIRLDIGAPNLFMMAAALVQESRFHLKARDWGLATSLAKAATDLAPGCPAAHLNMGWVVWSQNRSDLVPAFKHVAEAGHAALDDPVTFVALVANGALVLAGGLAMALALFVVVLLLRYARLIVHDLSHLFPPGAPPFFTGGIMGLALFLPVILGAGLIPTIFFWIAAAWIYAAKRERMVAGAALVVLAGIPFLYPSAAVLLDQGESDAAVLYRAWRDADARKDVEQVIAEAKGGSRDYLKLMAGALWLKRAGEYAESEALYQKVLSVSPRDVAGHIDLGNLYLVQDRFNEALAAYNNALSADPQSALAHYNLSKLFFRKGDLDKGHREDQEAKRLDARAVEAIGAHNSPSINRFVADAEPASSLLLERFLERGSPRRVLITGLLERWTLGDFRAGDIPYMVAAAVAAIVGLGLACRRFSPSVRCGKCGRPSCLRCTPEVTSPETCGQCFHVYVRKDVPDPRLRNVKEFEVRRHASAAALTTRAAALLLPGSGQVLLGSTVAGLCVMGLCAVAAVYLLTRGGPVPGGFADLNSAATWVRGAAGAAALGVYGLSVRAVFRRTG
ncbi:MAG: tetratricopeptide repeat protein [Deltaproteobacteria bacterium]|nr:tetratricopeptide repeat protein [Deltaproteobacteria bacterium]